MPVSILQRWQLVVLQAEQKKWRKKSDRQWKKQLVYNFSLKRFCKYFICTMGLLLVKLLLPYFNQLSGSELHFSFSQYPEMAWMLAGLTLLVGLLAVVILH